MDKSQKKVWKVAVVGCGAFANWQYLPNIRKEANAEIVAAVDIIPERAQKACEDYNIPNWYESVYELIEKCDFDIAIDAASIQAHHEINMAVLGAGKHLISQKPAAPSVEMLNEQINLAKEKGVKYQMLHSYELKVPEGLTLPLKELEGLHIVDPVPADFARILGAFELQNSSVQTEEE